MLTCNNPEYSTNVELIRGGADNATTKENRHHVFNDCIKRSCDVILSSVSIFVAAPLMLIVALLIKMTSPGPAFFKQKRLGQAGREFWCYKFRSMVVDAEVQLQRHSDFRKQFEENYKIKHDPRVTRFGALLRKTSLDELPQLFNILRGDLSLVGPRPIVPSERAKYGEYAEKLLSIKPGLSGLWQVYGRSDTTYDQRIQMDMTYIANQSLWLDLKLMALTVYVVIKGRGAY
jgi:exopolysaccharide biosynthesis polyprenyl glycosylphosphotransferase